MKKQGQISGIVTCLVFAALGASLCAAPLGTAFTYQGRLLEDNKEAHNLYDFQFKAFEDANGVVQVGSAVAVADVNVIDGYFTVELDFGRGVFDGDARWLEIGVRPGDQNDLDPYTSLAPLQKITPAPYAMYAKTADIAGGVSVPLELSGSVVYPEAIISGNDTGSGIGLNGSSNSGTGSYGISGSGTGVMGTNAGTGNYGLLGSSDYGAYGKHIASGNYGYLGDGFYGVCGRSEAASGVGVYGTSDNFFGVFGRTVSGTGVHGYNVSGNTMGKLATSDYGVYGQSGGGYAGYFEGKGYFSGNVGIGTTNPAERLEVVGTAKATYFVGDGSGLTNISLTETDPQVGSNTTNYLAKWNGSALVSGTVYDSGNVGIGTASPTQKLDVVGTVKATSFVGNGSGLTDISFTETDPQVGSNTTNYLPKWNGSALVSGTIYDNGNVGIGTASPSQKLHVVGNVYASGNVYEGGTVLSSRYLGMTATAVNSDMVDNKHASDFVSLSLVGSSLAAENNTTEETLMAMSTAGWTVKDDGDTDSDHTLILATTNTIIEYTLWYGSTVVQGEASKTSPATITFPHYCGFQLILARPVSGYIASLVCKENDTKIVCVYQKSHP